MPVFEIWEEGYRATGEHGTATRLGGFEAKDFDEAVAAYVKLARATAFPDIDRYYARGRRWVTCPVSDDHPLGRKEVTVHSIWGCRLFDNEADARKSNG